MTSPLLGRWLDVPRRTALLAAFLGLVVHLGALGNGFANDDEIVVAGDPGLHTLEGVGERLMEPYWPTAYGADVGSWRPLTTGLFGVTWVASGGAPWAFHLVALLLHAAATALVVLLLARLVAPATAGLAGILFAVHPVHVEAVANVVGLAEPLSALFALGALLLHLRSGRRSSPAVVLGVATLYGLAILAKEGAVVLPALVLLLDAARRELRPGDLPEYLRRRGLLYLALGGVLAVALGLRWRVLGAFGGATHPPGAGVLEEIPRIWTLATVWPHYLRLLVFPMDLSADYGPAVISVAYGWTLEGVVGVLLAVGALGGAWVAWRKGALLGYREDSPRIYSVAVLWVMVALLPVANVLFLSPVMLAERTLYLASVGAVAALAAVTMAAARQAPRLAMVGVTVAVVGLAARSVDRVPAWKDSRAVMATVLEEHPESGWAWWSWSRQLAAEGRTGDARRALAAATQLLNSEPQIGLDVGSHLMATGHPGPARFFLERVRRERPDWHSAAGLLAALELEEGRPEVALPLARTATELAPDNASMHHILAESLAATGRWAEAVSARRASLAGGFDGSWRSWRALSRELAAAGDTLAALAVLDSARSRTVDPGALDTLKAAGQALMNPNRDD